MRCEGSSVRAGAKEYCVMKTRRPFHDAAADCTKMGGHLAIVGDVAQAKALTTSIASPWGYGSGMWIGCSDTNKEGEWVCDGQPARYTNWRPGQPDNATALDDCAEWLADSGKWDDASCDARLGYLCKGDASMKCSGRRVEVGSSIYCAHGDDFRDWEGAKKACETSGGKLAAPPNDTDSKAIFEALKLPSAIPSHQPHEGVWIGLTDEETEGAFKWVTGAPLGFSNWLPGQPDDAKSAQDCVTLTLGDGRWNDAECGTPLPYLCEPN
jgi:hypothetical protein